MRTVATIIVLTSMAALAQTSTPSSFEVASVKISEPGKNSIDTGPSSVTMRNVRLTDCLKWAYKVQDYQIVGPNWMKDVWLDVFAKSTAPASESELRRMMQGLLTERFKSAQHRETKEVQALVLVVGKNGHKLTPNDKEGNPSFKTGKMNLTGDGATLSQLTDFLAEQLKEPVIDQTGLTGRYNYFLDVNAYVTDEIRKGGGPDGSPPIEANGIIAQAMAQQLGLKVDGKKVPVEMLIVEHIEKTPTEN